MRCHICDAALGEDEIKFNREHKDYDPCGRCLEVIRNVFGEEEDDQYVLLDDLDDDVITTQPGEDDG